MKTGFIDWTDNFIRLYQFEKQGGVFKLTDTASAPYEGDINSAVLNQLSSAVDMKWHLSVPLSILTLRELNFPFSSKSKIRDTITYELQGLLLKEAGDYVIAYLETGSVETATRVMAACREKDRAREIRITSDPACLEARVIPTLA